MIRLSAVIARSLLVALVPLFAAPHAQSQSQSSGIIRIIVPFAPGGINDTAARLLQPYLEKALGQTVIVDNKPGATGIVGTDAVARAAPDGHTLVMVASSFTALPATTAKLPYDSLRDLTPVALVGQNPLLFAANPKLGVTSLGDFVALAQRKPGKLNYATPGAAGQNQLVAELFSQRAGIKMQQIPYRGGTPAVQALIAGDVEFGVLSPLVSLPQIAAGNLKPLAVTSLARDPQLPNVPTVAEQGYPDFEATQWVGLLTAAGAPADVVTRLNDEVNKALQDKELIARLAQQGMSPGGGAPAAFGSRIAREIAEWQRVARAAGITPQ
ncbi:MAG: tripartite tricarboxylate transporter substrate binding protein [Alphaproteobacteria bacterium]|nr:tripartite tricarboxylate transporter substrate binding protein [Alphaproteobacteria bacterium]